MKISSVLEYILIICTICFIYSGLLKWYTYYNLSLNTILLFTIFILFTYLKGYKIATKHLLIIFIFICFLVFNLYSLIYSNSENYKYFKILKYYSLLIPIIILLNKNIDVNKFINIILLFNIISISIILYLLITNNIEYITRLYLDKHSMYPDYIIVSEMLACTGLLYFKNNNKFSYLLIFINTLLIFALGARGVIFIYTAIALYIIISKIEIKKYSSLISLIFLILIMSFSALLLFDYEHNVTERTINRIQSTITGKSTIQRLDHFRQSIDLINERPLIGHGIASYGNLTNGQDIRYYPHNIIIESFIEVGILGTIVILLYLIIPFILGIKYLTNLKTINLSLILILIYFLLLIQFLKSSSLEDAKTLVFWHSLLVTQMIKK
jgi:hypothetical protein